MLNDSGPEGVIRYLILSLFRISIEYYMRAVRILYTFKIHDWPLRAKTGQSKHLSLIAGMGGSRHKELAFLHAKTVL